LLEMTPGGLRHIPEGRDTRIRLHPTPVEFVNRATIISVYGRMVGDGGPLDASRSIGARGRKKCGPLGKSASAGSSAFNGPSAGLRAERCWMAAMRTASDRLWL